MAKETLAIDKPTSGYAVASLVLGVASLFLVWFFFIGIISAILSVVFGILGLRDIRAGTRKGKWMAVLGMTLSIASVVLLIIAALVIGWIIGKEVISAANVSLPWP